MISLNDIQKEVDFRDKESRSKELLVLRLVAEVGELTNLMTKEIMRDQDHIKKIKSELPDILFYLARIVSYYGLDFEQIWKEKMKHNSTKYQTYWVPERLSP